MQEVNFNFNDSHFSWKSWMTLWWRVLVSRISKWSKISERWMRRWPISMQKSMRWRVWFLASSGKKWDRRWSTTCKTLTCARLRSITSTRLSQHKVIRMLLLSLRSRYLPRITALMYKLQRSQRDLIFLGGTRIGLCLSKTFTKSWKKSRRKKKSSRLTRIAQKWWIR